MNSNEVEDVKPQVGMAFSTLDEAFEFYNSYAKVAGFGTRRSSVRKRKEVIVWQQFVCYKEGQHANSSGGVSDNASTTVERNRGIVRTGCKAKMTISKQQNATHFLIISFEESHNHELATPKKTHFLTSHRNVSKAKKILMANCMDASISTSQQVRLLAVEAGGFQNIGCTEKDMRNHVRDKRKKYIGVDAALLFDYFTLQQQKDPLFYFSFDQDEDRRMTRCFWTDSASRLAYTCFGDVVIFDTTYNTNKYSMIFAPIFGINQHTQTTFFGCGFLSDETTDSFVWFFEQFLQSMLLHKGPPKLIITDQDPAMTKAIAIALPMTFHRYCIWHITNKFQEKLGPLNFHHFYPYFRDSIYDSDNVEEFEISWRDALDKSLLHDHVWLQSIYDIRQRWVPAFVNHIFSAGCLSSQRAESGHAFFKKYVTKDNSLMDFVTRYTLALEYQREKELNEDWCNINQTPKLNSGSPMEKQMAVIYSRNIFKEFQHELSESAGYEQVNSIDANVYVVYRVEGTSKARQLTHDRSTNFVRCTCRLFELKGIPCRYILHFFIVTQVYYLPEGYILLRWTKNAKTGRLRDEMNSVSNKSLFQARAEYYQRSSYLIEGAVTLRDGAAVLDSGFNLIEKELKQLKLTQNQIEEPTRINSSEELNMLDPKHVKAKGCGARLKTRREKSIKKGRLCHGCGLRDQAHDKRNCPMLIGSSNTSLNEDYTDSSEQDDSTRADSD